MRSAIESVRQAEERIDGLVKDLHDIETELSLLIHRSETATNMSRGQIHYFFGALLCGWMI